MRPAGSKAPWAAIYLMDARLTTNGPGIEVLNYHNLHEGKDGGPKYGLAASPPWPNGFGKLPNHPYRRPEYLETPRLLFDRRKGFLPRDIENFDGMWIISPTMKAVLQAVDADACEFIPCETYLPSGESARETWICTVTRAFVTNDVVDLAASDEFLRRFMVARHDRSRHLHFVSEAIGGKHLFRLPIEFSREVFCDQAVKDACNAAGLKGLEFLDVPDKKARSPEWWVAQSRRQLAKQSPEVNASAWYNAKENLARTLSIYGSTQNIEWLHECAKILREIIARYEALHADRGSLVRHYIWLANTLILIGARSGAAKYLGEAEEIYHELLASFEHLQSARDGLTRVASELLKIQGH